MPRRLLPEERAVVLGEVRPRVGPGDAGEQPQGEDAEVAAAEVAATPHEPGHRLARGLDPLLPGDLREHRHAPRQRRPVEPVQVLDHPGGQRRAHAGLAPGPGPPAKEPELRHGAGVDRDAPAEPPAVPGDELARPLADDRHLVGAETDRDVGTRELGPGAVGAGAHGDLAPLVARSHEPGHAGERPGGQGAEGGAVRLEELAPRAVPPPVPPLAEAVCHPEEGLVVLPQVADAGNGDEYVGAHEGDLSLDVTLLVPRVGVAEPRLEAVVEPEPAEELGLPHLVEDSAPRPGRVVEHDDGRDSPYVAKDVGEALTHALRRAPSEHLEPRHAGVRERDHEEQHPLPAVRGVEVGLAEVGLRGSGGPLEVEEALGGSAPHLELPVVDVLLDQGVPAVVAGAAELGEDLPRGVALLPPDVPVGLQYGVDRRLVRIQLRRPRDDAGGRLGREVDLVEELSDRLPVVPRPTGYLGYAVPLRPQPPHVIDLRHARHPLHDPSPHRWLGPQRLEGRSSLGCSACRH